MIPGSIQNGNRRKWLKLLQKNSLEAWVEEHLYSIRSINFNIRSGEEKEKQGEFMDNKKKELPVKNCTTTEKCSAGSHTLKSETFLV